MTTVDPDAPLRPAEYHRASVGGSTGAKPTETLQYGIVYDTFCEDKEFWQHWRVVDCARNSPEESISQENASIRVVMDLDDSQKLFPTAYTPGFPTLPRNAAPLTHIKARDQRKIDGLHPGYSVALEVHILEDARIMLKHQRDFRNGTISPRFNWLSTIISEHDAKHGIVQKVPDKGEQRGALQEFSCKLMTFSEQYGDTRFGSSSRSPQEALTGQGLVKVADKDHLDFRLEKLYAESVAESAGPSRRVAALGGLIDAAGEDNFLPQRESGSWGSAQGPTPAQRRREQQQGEALDAELRALLAKTRSSGAKGAAN